MGLLRPFRVDGLKLVCLVGERGVSARLPGGFPAGRDEWGLSYPI